MRSTTLVIQLARLGDLLQSRRLVKSLQTDSQVHLAVDVSLARFASVLYPEAVIHPLQAHFRADRLPEDILAFNRKAVQELALDHDLVVNLNFSGLNFSLAGLFDPEKVKGYITCGRQQMRHPWTRLFFRLAGHRKLSPLNLMDFWGLYAPSPVPPDKVNPEPADEGAGLGVVLAGRDIRRSIPMSTLVALVRAARSRLKSSGVFLLGSASEKPLAREFKSMAPGSLSEEIKDYTGRTSLEDLPDLMSSLEMVLCPDTGLMHLAAHAGTRVLAFFFSSALCFETGPYGRGHQVYQMLPACAPCRESRKCNFELACHQILGEAQILKSVCQKGNIKNLEALHCTSDLDDLGVNYFTLEGKDPWQDQRRALRELIRRTAGLAPGEAAITPEASAMFFHESQWALGY